MAYNWRDEADIKVIPPIDNRLAAAPTQDLAAEMGFVIPNEVTPEPATPQPAYNWRTEADITPLPTPKKGFWEGLPQGLMDAGSRDIANIKEVGRQAGLTGRYAAEGMAGLPLMAGDALNAGINYGTSAINQAAGTNIPQLGSATQAFSDLLPLPQPQNAQERVVGDMSRALAGTGGMVKAGQAALNLTPEAATGIRALGASFAENPLVQGVTSVTGTGAGSITKEAGGSPAAQMAATVFGSVAPLAVGQAIKVRASQGIMPNSDDVKAVASQAYETAAAKGGVLKPEYTNKFIDDVEKLLPQTEEGKLFAGDDQFSSVVDRVRLLRDRPLSLLGLQEIDEKISNYISKEYGVGGLSKDGAKIAEIQNALRGMMYDAPESAVAGGKEGFRALAEGRELWSAHMKLKDIETILSRAAGADKASTSIQKGFNSLYNNTKRMRGYTDAEKKLIKKVGEGNIAVDVVSRVFGSKILPIITAATGGGLAGTAASTATSIASSGLANKIKVSQAQDVARQIIKRTGLPNKPKL